MYIIMIAINPDFAKDFSSQVMPILFVVALIAVLWSIIRTIAKGDYSNIIIQMLVCAIVLVFIKNPELFLKLGTFLIGFITELGGGLIEK